MNLLVWHFDESKTMFWCVCITNYRLQVNRIRELPQNSKIIATHTDSPDVSAAASSIQVYRFHTCFWIKICWFQVLIWDVETQPNRHAVLGAAHSRPDLVLTGHQDNAEFALAMCPTEPFVLSGGLCFSSFWSFCFSVSFLSYKGFLFLLGKDKSVVLWSIQDHITTAGSTDSKSSGSIIKQTGEGGDKTESPSLGPRGVYHGHDDTVEDVAFSPTR